MTRRQIKFILVLTAMTLLAGCATGYRDRLSTYQQNSPTSFDRQTMDWLEEIEKPASTIQPAKPPVFKPMMSDLTTTSTQDVSLVITARLTGLPPEEIAPRLETLAQPEALRALFEKQFGWKDYALGVAAANPAVQAARERWQATLRQFSQADYLEALVGQYRTFTLNLDIQAGKPMNKSMVRQFFPYPGTITLKGELIHRQAELARLDWEKAMRKALVDAGQAYFTSQYLHRTESTSRENVELVRDMQNVVEQQYRTGDTSHANLIKIQTELERQINMLEDIQSRQHSAVAEIAALLDLPNDVELGRPENHDLPLSPLNLDSLTSQALTTRQEVAMQRAKVARADAAIQLGETMNRPLASQGYSDFERGANPEASAGESQMSYGLMAKFQDRPAYAQAEAFLAEMRQRRQAEAFMLEDTIAQTRSLARVWLQDFDIARREEKLIREIVLPQSQSAYEASSSAYASGDISFLDMLDAERDLVRARLQLDQAQYNLNQTLVRKAEVTGQLPNFP